MVRIFEVKDTTGRRIRLTRERWKHITSPESLHAYMTNHLEKIIETLQSPDKAFFSSSGRSSLYRYYKQKKRFMRVLSKYLNGDGYVITAYFTRKIEK